MSKQWEDKEKSTVYTINMRVCVLVIAGKRGLLCEYTLAHRGLLAQRGRPRFEKL